MDALAEAFLELIKNENRNQLQPLKPFKNEMTPEELEMQQYMSDWMRQWNFNGGNNYFDPPPIPANDPTKI
jgi:hypothetical protein